MYSKIRARVKVGHLLYEWIKYICGTNPGGPLIPDMFTCMLADLSDYRNTEFGLVLDMKLVHTLYGPMI